MTREESEIRSEILKKYKAMFPAGHLDRVWCGEAVTRHGSRIIGAKPGTPDLVGYLPDGRFLGIEVKVPGARPQRHEPAQDRYREKATHAGALCFKTTSWEEALAVITDALKLPFE
jgi:hypothetical protein